MTICLHPRSYRDLSGKNTKCGYSFSLSQKHGNHTQKTLIAQLCFTHKTGPKIFPGLSLSKSPIKNYATLFGSDRVVKPDQTKLGPTKPNIGVTNSTKDRSPSINVKKVGSSFLFRYHFKGLGVLSQMLLCSDIAATCRT